MSEAARTVTFEQKIEDYIAANRLHARKLFRRWLTPVLVVLIVVAYFAPAAIGAIIGLVAFVGFGYLVLLPYQARKIFREQKSFRHSLTLIWSDAGLVTQSADSHVLIPWSDYFGWAEDANVFVFYQSSRLIDILPKSAVSVQQMADLRQCITTPKA